MARARADAERIHRFMAALGERLSVEARVYFTGGASAVLVGWRPSTLDLDIEIHPAEAEDPIAQELPRLKEELEINVEFASPSHFLPELPGWQDRSPFILRSGSVAFHHYDFHAQALAKAVRNIADDATDVRSIVDRGLVEPERVRELFGRVERRLYRYPSLDPASVRRRVAEAFPES